MHPNCILSDFHRGLRMAISLKKQEMKSHSRQRGLHRQEDGDMRNHGVLEDLGIFSYLTGCPNYPEVSKAVGE